MNEYLVEAGPYKDCIMTIRGGQITYRPAPKIPKKPDPVPMELATGIAQPDSPINKGGLEIIHEVESDEELLGLERLITHPGLSVITRNKLIKHLEETDLLEHQVIDYYEVVVAALLKKKTFKASIELGNATL